MPNPNEVAKLIMQLMERGRSGGMPMQASPELIQYLAHAEGGTAPPQQRINPRAEVLQGPGSGAAAIRDPDFLSESNSDLAIGMRNLERTFDETGRPRDVDPMDVTADMPPARPDMGNFEGTPLFIWARDRNGKMIKIDGPFTNDVDAMRELRMLRQSGLDVETEIRPDFDINPV